MKISILTLFPDMFTGPFDLSIIKRARAQQRVEIEYINIRCFASDSYGTVDDHPYGGGQGMILKVDVVDKALKKVKSKKQRDSFKTKTILLDPQGTPYSQKTARTLSTFDHLILICGHYEGVDERIRSLVDEQISIGDYILTGGELPAMVLVDSIIRLIPGVLKSTESTKDESFSGPLSLLEYPQYTKPARYRNKKVPEVLLSGNHAKISLWRAQQSLSKTKKIRPDLLKKEE